MKCGYLGIVKIKLYSKINRNSTRFPAGRPIIVDFFTILGIIINSLNF